MSEAIPSDAVVRSQPTVVGNQRPTAGWVVAASTAVAFALRLVHLGRDSLWYDETVSVYLAGQPATELVAHTARDIHPPAYYLLLRAWLLVSGYPTGHADPSGFRLELMAAFLSLMLGVVLVPLTWQLAKRLRLGDSVAALAALLAALSPFGVWYSQEVRMYTLGACLAVLCLLATTAFLMGRGASHTLVRAAILFALATAAGLATLYYFAFLLASINLLVIPVLALRWQQRRAARSAPPHETARKPAARLLSESAARPLILWLLAQAGALALYLPWLPIAWRQATDPPVPPWRMAPQIGQALVESWNALSFGQSADAARLWPLLLVTLALVAGGVAAAWRRRGQPRLAAIFLLVATFGPPALILLASAATPLYHVRYLFTFAPPFSILLALGLATLAHWRKPAGRWLAAAALLAILAGSAFSLRIYWTDPRFVADDLRSAVRELAQRWRPGDIILANAGYTYPALLTYWPEPVAWHGRLTDYAQFADTAARPSSGAVILQTGHVDGAPDLGWGDPRSDFYALPKAGMQTALRDLAAQTDRLWHFRLYDTVNDPSGAIREALDSGWTLIDDRVYPGEATLRVQGWQGTRHVLSASYPPAVATFGDWLELALAPDALPSQVEAGGWVDVPRALWRRPGDRPGQPVSLSLRLVDPTGAVWAAADGPLGGNQLDLVQASELVQPLRLAVPPGTAPGRYDLVVVAYDPQTGQALPATSPAGAAGDAAVLGQVEIVRPAAPRPIQPALADFGPLRLVEAGSPAAVISPGDAVPVDLLWQAAPDFAGEPLVVVVQLLDKDSQVVASLEAEPLSGRYPTTQWQSGDLVRDRHVVTVPDTVSAGTYRLIVGLYRAADGQRLPAAGGLLEPTQRNAITVREIIVR